MIVFRLEHTLYMQYDRVFRSFLDDWRLNESFGVEGDNFIFPLENGEFYGYSIKNNAFLKMQLSSSQRNFLNDDEVVEWEDESRETSLCRFLLMLVRKNNQIKPFADDYMISVLLKKLNRSMERTGLSVKTEYVEKVYMPAAEAEKTSEAEEAVVEAAETESDFMGELTDPFSSVKETDFVQTEKTAETVKLMVPVFRYRKEAISMEQFFLKLSVSAGVNMQPVIQYVAAPEEAEASRKQDVVESVEVVTPEEPEAAEFAEVVIPKGQEAAASVEAITSKEPETIEPAEVVTSKEPEAMESVEVVTSKEPETIEPAEAVTSKEPEVATSAEVVTPEESESAEPVEAESQEQPKAVTPAEAQAGTKISAEIAASERAYFVKAIQLFKRAVADAQPGSEKYNSVSFSMGELMYCRNQLSCAAYFYKLCDVNMLRNQENFYERLGHCYMDNKMGAFSEPLKLYFRAEQNKDFREKHAVQLQEAKPIAPAEITKYRMLCVKIGKEKYK